VALGQLGPRGAVRAGAVCADHRRDGYPDAPSTDHETSLSCVRVDTGPTPRLQWRPEYIFNIHKAAPTMHSSILDAIGNTPLLPIDGLWVKCEFLNPSGSIKARLASYCVTRAEAEGLLRPGDTIVEATS